ncbi:lasso RiPP family leader peptide-containing protein [Streptomyces decoyicus]|uniref:lasso RiPP family leader peptide-containing protein n=1 Tax=Streptomyces decoyicus TaxID=249567 RepID=UPI0033D80CA9
MADLLLVGRAMSAGTIGDDLMSDEVLQEQDAPVVYEPPVLAEAGDFAEKTQGRGGESSEGYGTYRP